MSLLTEPLPRAVEISGAEIPIAWDFRVSLRFGDMIQRLTDEPDMEFLAAILPLYSGEAVDASFDVERGLERAYWFFGCGKDEDETKPKEKTKKQILSYDYDADRIYAAFRSQYSLDLVDIDHLHWWRFRALLEGLKQDEYLVQIMHFRSLDASDFAKMSKEHKSYYHKMQKEHALPAYISPEEKILNDEINALLRSGGDISSLLARSKDENG